MFGKIIKYPVKSRRQQHFIISISATLAIAGGFLFLQALKPAVAKGEGAKIINVFENGVRTSFKTNASTIGDALKEQGISVSQEDNVEPRLSEQLTDTIYNVNIYRANPFVIEDGATRRKVMTAAKTSRKIAESAGLSLHKEDLVLPQSSNNFLEDGAATVLVVKRAKEITVKLFGKTQILRTQADTIADFLKEKNIKLSAQDQLSKDLNSPVILLKYGETVNKQLVSKKMLLLASKKSKTQAKIVVIEKLEKRVKMAKKPSPTKLMLGMESKQNVKKSMK